MARKPDPKKLPSWRVTLIRKKGEPIATVAAPDAEAAVAKAIELYAIEERYHQRLMAVRVQE